jgi:hypothetical protein
MSLLRKCCCSDCVLPCDPSCFAVTASGYSLRFQNGGTTLSSLKITYRGSNWFASVLAAPNHTFQTYTRVMDGLVARWKPSICSAHRIDNVIKLEEYFGFGTLTGLVKYVHAFAAVNVTCNSSDYFVGVSLSECDVVGTLGFSGMGAVASTVTDCTDLYSRTLSTALDTPTHPTWTANDPGTLEWSAGTITVAAGTSCGAPGSCECDGSPYP